MSVTINQYITPVCLFDKEGYHKIFCISGTLDSASHKASPSRVYGIEKAPVVFLQMLHGSYLVRKVA